MTDDLVKRLRLIGEKRLQCTACYKFIDTADEAADRIEKLEAALREAYTLLWKGRLYRGYEGGPLSEPIAEMIERNCREALEEKDD